MARSVPTEKNPHGLTDQQLRFCQEYAKSLNATQAYKAAGYVCKNDAVAWAASSRLLGTVKVKAYLGEVLNLTSVSVVHEAVAIAFAKITDVMEWDEEGVSVIASSKINARGERAIKTIKCKKKTTTRTIGELQEVDVTVEWEVSLHDKLAAIEKLMKKLDLYPKTEVVGEGEVLDKMMEMNIVSPWMADCANKIYSRAREEVATLLSGELPEPLVYQLSKERESTGGLSEDTYNRIRAEIMGIDAQSIPQLPAKISSESVAG